MDVTNDYRCVGVRPEMHISVWKPSENMMISCEFDVTIKLADEIYKRRLWADLVGFTAEWDDDRILDEVERHEEKLKDPHIRAV